jgi:hypothetical protein
MIDLGDCPNCGKSLAGYETELLPDTRYGKKCPRCEEDVYCGTCGDLTE